MNNYIIRKAIKKNDDKNLNTLMTKVFYPEEVGPLAEVMFNHLPGMKSDYWYIAEEKATAEMVAAFTLIPWMWEMEGIKLKVAEMGLVGTLSEHRGRGLMKMLNLEFDKTLEEENFDLAVIQGIPGFYHKFGYHYSLAMENHINIPLKSLPEVRDFKDNYHFQKANIGDIPFLLKEDEKYRSSYLITSVRNESNWKYLLTQSLNTDYGSEIWIMDSPTGLRYYFKILLKGFGTGLIISEISENIPADEMYAALHFCRQLAIERRKPYIRLNLHNESDVVSRILSNEISKSKSYAWQIKIPDKLALLTKMIPLLEKRIISSEFAGITGKLRLNLFTETFDICWNEGHISKIESNSGDEPDYTFCVCSELFESLILGHRSWEELQHIRPDVSPELIYIIPTEESLSDKTGLIIDVLFPPRRSWIYSEY
jgi:hypothetical protein